MIGENEKKERKMPENKSFKEKIKGVFEAKTLAIIGLIVMSTWNFVSDTFKEGADSKFNSKVVNITLTDHRINKWMNDRFDSLLTKSIKNPFLWYDALSSNYVSEYAETKATEVRSEVEKELIKLDSIQKNFITSLGEAMGVRDDRVIEKLGAMGKEYIEGRLGTRRVTANF